MHKPLTKENGATFANREARQTATPALSAISLGRNVADAILTEIKGFVKTWAEMTEYEQERVFHRFDEIVDMTLRGVVWLVSLRNNLLQLLVRKGGFTTAESDLLLFGPHSSERSKIERGAAIWLRGELYKLQTAGPSPVRTRDLLSRSQIADLAIALLDYESDVAGKPAPTPELIDLLAGLLDVDRRRSAMAKSPEFRDEYNDAAATDGWLARQGKTITVRDLAKYVGVSTGTISAWRKSDRYKHLVELVKRAPQKQPKPRIDDNGPPESSAARGCVQ